MKKIKQLVKISESIEAIEILCLIAKILSVISAVVIFGFLSYVGYVFFTTQRLCFGLEWGLILFAIFWGFCTYGFFSFAFKNELFSGPIMVLWKAAIGDLVILLGIFNCYQVPPICLTCLIFVFALSTFIFRHKKKAIKRIQKKIH